MNGNLVGYVRDWQRQALGRLVGLVRAEWVRQRAACLVVLVSAECLGAALGAQLERPADVDQPLRRIT